MARPKTITIDYFPLECDLHTDEKMEMIIGEFGGKGEALYIKILSFGYANKGYYAEWDEAAQLRFLKRYNYYGFSASFLKECVQRFFKWRLFDESVFNEFQVLTSIRMQETWLEATRRRHIGVIVTKMWLLGEFLQPKPHVLVTEMPQRKEKEIKEKEMKENAAKNSSPPPEIIPEKNRMGGYIDPNEKAYELIQQQNDKNRVRTNDENRERVMLDPYFIEQLTRYGYRTEAEQNAVMDAYTNRRNQLGKESDNETEYRKFFWSWVKFYKPEKAKAAADKFKF